ncbi:MAG: gamma carbonic anhydrase family protein [Rubripirellula sp.]|nr:gamma carbonic anhydrase family protein [Rhodopirellula sp.]MCH1438944.1 gamma carbonic anhydrase family protein [Rubripirellula sp.]OUX03573.1 MAG: gamma carbonic anhydrase family protein [Planctomycetaceae bacterium TMED240]
MNRREIQKNFRSELIAEDVFIAGNATVRGAVTIGDHSSVWFGAVIRGDTEVVEIGCRSNIQDLAVLHADPGYPCCLGDGVTVGHSAVVHGAKVESGALIGIRAVVLNGAKIGSGAIVGAGAVVTEGMEVPAGHLAVGVPAKLIRKLTSEDTERLTRTAAHYVHAAKSYRESGEAT